MAARIEEYALKSNESFLAGLQSQKERLEHLIDEIDANKIDDPAIRDAVHELNLNFKKLRENCGSDAKPFLPFNFNFLML